MNIKKIYLNNFRNYNKLELDIENGINIFYGNNAQGKTNLLEAIYISSIGKSYRTNKDEELLSFNKEKFNIILDYEVNNRVNNLVINFIKPNEKIIKVNGIKVNKISDFVGTIKTVIFSPDELNIIKGSPTKRRRFIDILISQISTRYVYDLWEYNKILNQRNSLLKQLKNNSNNIQNNKDILDVWNDKYIQISKKIVNNRNKYINKLKEKISKIHQNLTNGKESIEIKYVSDIIDKSEEKIKDILDKKINIDVLKGYTSIGPNKDEIEVYINNQLVNIYGSQGQNRTALLSLKIAEAEVIKEETDILPILLLDDVMSELDINRIRNLLITVSNYQVIITTTHKEDINNIENGKIYNVNNGKITQEK